MANAEQLALLKAGIEGWNKWRDEEPDVKIDLREDDLSGADFTETDLRGANLSQATVTTSSNQESNPQTVDSSEVDTSEESTGFQSEVKRPPKPTDYDDLEPFLLFSVGEKHSAKTHRLGIYWAKFQ